MSTWVTPSYLKLKASESPLLFRPQPVYTPIYHETWRITMDYFSAEKISPSLKMISLKRGEFSSGTIFPLSFDTNCFSSPDFNKHLGAVETGCSCRCIVMFLSLGAWWEPRDERMVATSVFLSGSGEDRVIMYFDVALLGEAFASNM